MVAALGPTEIGLVVVVVVLLFGAKRLPDLARSIGASARELRKGLADDPNADDESVEVIEDG
jgi:sec-independent protein translocase protein TatA